MANEHNDALLDLFARECEGHLGAIRAALVELASADAATSGGATARIEATLHTLAGAARAMELLDLEYLCRALENLAHAGTDEGWNAPRLALFDAALKLAPELLAPTPRARNQMMALAARCAAGVPS
ncbi:MAG: Hpt domain-containing protein [Massilia sp.]